MEPDTEKDIWDNWLSYRSEIGAIVLDMKTVWDKPDNQMSWNLAYATAMARVHYYRVPESLPHYDDIAGLASYWKSYYNTPKGKGTVEQAMLKYKTLVLDKL